MPTTPRLDTDECTLDCDHDLPATVVIYNDEDVAWIGRARARVVCSEDEVDQLTDRLVS